MPGESSVEKPYCIEIVVDFKEVSKHFDGGSEEDLSLVRIAGLWFWNVTGSHPNTKQKCLVIPPRASEKLQR
jgi:hypothetical protein